MVSTTTTFKDAPFVIGEAWGNPSYPSMKVKIARPINRGQCNVGEGDECPVCRAGEVVVIPETCDCVEIPNPPWVYWEVAVLACDTCGTRHFIVVLDKSDLRDLDTPDDRRHKHIDTTAPFFRFEPSPSCLTFTGHISANGLNYREGVVKTTLALSRLT